MGKKDIICWFSGGVTSAVACKLAIDIFGKDRCRIIFMDTHNEDDDTYRFLRDCQHWYGVDIEIITMIGRSASIRKDLSFDSIQSIWRHYKSLNVNSGAICSSVLKRDLRLMWERENKYKHQVFGFDFGEVNRAISLNKNYPKSKGIFPLLMYGYSKKDAMKIVENAGIKLPVTYHYGFHNNNCFKTGCVQGGIGYWQKMRREFPDKFYEMAKMEHELTDLRGYPVTMLKDQSDESKQKLKQDDKYKGHLVFLMPHPDYPENKDISMMKAREPQPLMECNGFCGINDLSKRNPTELEINFEFT